MDLGRQFLCRRRNPHVMLAKMCFSNRSESRRRHVQAQNTENPWGQIHLGKEGSMLLGDSKSRLSLTVVLPAQQRGRRFLPRADTCRIDRKQFSQVAWPVDLMGSDMPPSRTSISQVIRGPNPPRRFSECGSYCHGPPHCSASVAGSEHGCFCGIPSSKGSRALGLDLVAPVPVCLVLAHVVANASHGRNADVQYLDERGMPYQCPCSATSVSNRCCGSKDGVVHAASLYCYHEHWGY